MLFCTGRHTYIQASKAQVVKHVLDRLQRLGKNDTAEVCFNAGCSTKNDWLRLASSDTLSLSLILLIGPPLHYCRVWGPLNYWPNERPEVCTSTKMKLKPHIQCILLVGFIIIAMHVTLTHFVRGLLVSVHRAIRCPEYFHWIWDSVQFSSTKTSIVHLHVCTHTRICTHMLTYKPRLEILY